MFLIIEVFGDAVEKAQVFNCRVICRQLIHCNHQALVVEGMYTEGADQVAALVGMVLLLGSY